MVILKGSTSTVKKTTQGRKKIEIKKIENNSNRQVTFSKRRVGLFKKASELCILSGAEITIIVQSLGKRVFAFSHPKDDTIIDRFLNGVESPANAGAGEPDNCPTAKARDYNRHYSDVCKELEAEKKRKEAIEEAKRAAGEYGGGVGFWWDEAVDGLEVEELEIYAAALEELMKKVNVRADDLVLVQNQAGFLPDPNPDMGDGLGGCLLEDMGMSVNHNQGISSTNGFYYGNCFLENGFGEERL